MSARTRMLQALLRQDLVSFTQKCFGTVAPAQTWRPNWHIDSICWHLQECLAGRIRRLIITVPPRHLKSLCGAIAFPAWALGREPTRRIIAASYSVDLARKHALDCRAVTESGWYRTLFPHTRLHPDKNTETEVMTTRRGFRLATSIGGTLTGRGGNLIIIDDPLKPAEALSESKREAVNQWYDGTLYSRLDDKERDVIVLIMQRLHVDDLVGHVLKQEPWVHLDIPAIAEAPLRYQIGPDRWITRRPGDLLHPARESETTLNHLRATLGTYNFAAQYQQRPAPPGGAMIRRAWLQEYEALPARGGNDRVVQSWDTASKAEELHDYSACTTWLEHGNEYYLIDVVRERLEYPELRRRVVEEADRRRADAVLIEDRASGTHLIQDLRREGVLHPIAISPEGDKVTRMAAQSAKLEAGRVLLPAGAPWRPDFLTEILQFPYGRHDDQVDSMSQFLTWASESWAPPLRFL